MAFHENQTCVSVEAGSDLSSSQYLFVSVATDGQVDVSGNGAAAFGVLQNKPAAAGRPAEVAIGGLTKVTFGATVDEGQEVASDASGKCVPLATGDVCLGIAVKGGAADEIGTIAFDRGRTGP